VCLPRIDVLILLFGLACTIWGKLVLVGTYKPANYLPEMVVIAPDVLFFAAVALFIRFFYILRPSAWIARCAVLIASLVAIWSVLNTRWLLKTGVQLQPGVLFLFFRDVRDIWPIARAHLFRTSGMTAVIVIGALVACVFLFWALMKPRKVIATRRHHLRWAFALLLIMAAARLAACVEPPPADAGLTRPGLSFSSHWYALLAAISPRPQAAYPLHHSPNIYLANTRKIEPPETRPDQWPNVVLVLLEGVSYPASSLAPDGPDSTPYLARLAKEGIEFRTTRVPVPYTSKAFWATFTGITPLLGSDNVETVPVDTHYEGLPTVLARVGYQSAFFQMCKGDFECTVGLFANLGFDWAWFRENLEDPSANLGYLAGDDFRMLEPAFEWLGQTEQPFFLTMITSVGHDPFDVPDWFGKPAQNLRGKYLQTVRYTDAFLRRLCTELDARGLAENTLLCVLGDHGTSFRVERARGRWVPYEEVIRVPWVIYWPGHVSGGRVVTWPCSQLDVAPTILALLGFDITEADFEGADAMQEPDSDRRFYFSSLIENSPIGFVQKDRKVIYWPYIDKVFEYDLLNDPLEKNPKEIPARLSECLRQDILSWEKRSQIAVDPKKHTRRFQYSHWQTFSTGRSAWAYYVP
jgi:glucan phosphoethanolaminetransferase (alkaline phosphatase superfamily)